MRREGIEEHGVAGLGRIGLEVHLRDLLFGQRCPLLADQAAVVPAGDNLQAAVLDGCRIDRHQCSDVEVGVVVPAGLDVLVRLEAVAPGHLEVDLLLEERGGLAEQLGDRLNHAALVEQPVEGRVEAGEVLDSLDHAMAGQLEVVFVVDHVLAGLFLPAEQLLSPGRDLRHVRGAVEARREDEAVASEGVDLVLAQDADGLGLCLHVASAHSRIVSLLPRAFRGAP